MRSEVGANRVNVLRLSSNELVPLDYSDLLEKISTALQQQNPFRISSDTGSQQNRRYQLIIDIDTIASQVAAMLVDSPLEGSANSARAATVNFSPGFRERFPAQIHLIKENVKQLLVSTISQIQPQTSVEQFVADLIADLQTFRGETPKLDFTYPFGKYSNLQKQRVKISHSASSNRHASSPLLKFHKLTITVQNTHDFNAQLRQGLENYINVQFAGVNQSDCEELGYVLEDLQENPQSDFYLLKLIVDTETLGKLQKEGYIYYLEFLKDNINTSTSNDNASCAIYLQDLIRRLRLINNYISDVEKSDGHYDVSYAGTLINYRNLFSRADAFDLLPIIPKIEGYLGETTDESRGEIQFIFGLKLKLNNPVQAHGGRIVFDYHLHQIDPDNKEHREKIKSQFFVEKVLKIAFLYYFVFAGNAPSVESYHPNYDLEYDPISNFEQKVLLKLKESKEPDKTMQGILRGIKRGLEQEHVQSKLKLLKERLVNLLKQKKTFPTREYPIYIPVKRSILEQEISKISNNNTFFQPVLRGNPKEVLKYISVGEANTETNSLCTLPAKLVISEEHYFSTDDRQTFSMEYDVAQPVPVMPVLLVPKEDQCQKIYNNWQRRLVVFLYSLAGNKLESQQAFTYRFTFSLLAYTCLKVLLSYTNKRLFIPILRFHLSNKQDDAPIEKFMVSLSKVLSHLLNEEHRSNAQGVDIRKLTYKAPNVLSSLYSVLPKKFYINTSNSHLDKLAIVIVSSRESDAKRGSSQKISNLMGEVIGVSRTKDGAVRLQLIKAFSENHNYQNIFREPTVIIDEVSRLYRNGYRHFVYIAKAPYSSTLHMTQSEDDDGLFFMSRDVISALKAHDGIKIYPMFFDKYYVTELEKLGISLYIQDTMELTSLVADPSKKSVVFFNLFNGMKVGPDQERNYRGVISYATLLNIYKGILDDEDIRTGLMYDTALKNDILQYLTLFHFSRYEKAKDISLKLDPYENLIGDDSVGKLSLFNQMSGKIEFNSLAFLTEVRKVLNVQKE